MQDFAIASEPLIDKNQTNRPWAMASNGWSAIQTLATTANEGVGGEWEQIATEIASFFMLGNNLLIAPITNGREDQVALP